MVSFLTLLPLSKDFVMVVHSKCCYALLWLLQLQFLLMSIRELKVYRYTRIKDIQIGDHEIKIVSFADDTTVFLRDFSCLTKIELNLVLCEKASSSN